jgi:hypothetical protein
MQIIWCCIPQGIKLVIAVLFAPAYGRYSVIDIDLLIAGGCRGADTLAVWAARQCSIRYIEYPAEWERFGKNAGVCFYT